jgi:predicted GNAT family acetyltransferase
VLQTSSTTRPLGPEDLSELLGLIRRDPLVNVFVRSRVDATRLNQRWIGGQVLGYFENGALVSACHAGANIVPVEATDAAVAAFAERLLRDRVRPSSIVGPRDPVLDLWGRVESAWGPARSPRLAQPFLAISTDSPLAPDPRVRRIVLDELDVLYPASVAMFTEEVGVDPELGGSGYRARVAQLVAQGWAFGIIEDGEVLFKAEVGAVSPEACQLQGVYVRPDRRGHGIAAGALAAVVQQARRSIAPVVTLFVNDHNVVARRAYERVGFEQTTTFASILL